MINRILLLTPSDSEKVPTKTLDKDLNLISSYPKGMKEFYFEEIHYDNFHQALETIFGAKKSFMVLGRPTEYGEQLIEEQSCGVRRKKEPKPTIKDVDSTEMVLDLDDHILEDFDPLKPEPAIINFLDEHEINCDVTWQITSSQKLRTKETPNPLARIRLYFSAHKRFSLQYRKAWSQLVPESDGSVYTCSQPIYTAPPNIVGKDPIKKRHGFIKGERRTFVLPKLKFSQVTKNSGFSRGTEYDFEDKNIPEEVLSGRVYRRYFMPLAFHYANKIQEREAIFYIIAGKAQKVKNREFSETNTYQYIDDAINHIENEKDVIKSQIKESEDKVNQPIPKFPNNTMSTWPEPWPSIWKNFKTVPRQLEEPLLFPTVLSLNAFFLRANFVTRYGRRPNMFFLNLTPSTGNKDVNSKNVIREVDNIFKLNGKKVNAFTGILNSESNITADSTFLQSFSETEELFWINTEATRIFQQIKQAGGISSVAALSDKLIEVVDGHEITGKVKASGKVKTIEDPNCQILFYAQPETIERFIDDEMVDSGLFGRSLISIIPKLKLDRDTFSMFHAKDYRVPKLSQGFIDFYSDPVWAMANMGETKVVLQPTESDIEVLDNWAKKELYDYIEDDETFHKLLTRLGNSAEQLYCIVLGVCQMFDRFQKKKPRQSIDVKCLLPILTYWKDTKIYSVKNLVNTELDPLNEEILRIIDDVISKPKMASNSKAIKIVKEYKLVPKSQVMRILGTRTKLIRKLSADGDKRNATARAGQLIELMIKHQVLIEKHIDGILCIGQTR